MANEKIFHVGLCLAGAVSAGAYTAGVLDYLLEALQEWEERKQAGEAVPTHRVQISVIGGASAGGMTGLITAAVVNKAFKPLRAIDQQNIWAPQPQNPFYHSWVDLIQDDMFPLMLDTSDIKPKAIYSALNSAFIDQVAQKVMCKNESPVQRPYVARNLKIFATLSNLGGYACDITFKADSPDVDKYYVSRHNDYACFSLNETEYRKDGWIPLNFETEENLDIARDAAMATGAFPVGLKARMLKRSKDYVNDLSWLQAITNKKPIEEDLHCSLHVDGGLLNNEPFDRVRDVLVSLTGQAEPHEYQEYDSFNSTILMVDPFPSELEKFNPQEDTVFKAMGGTLSAMLGQLRTKPDPLIKAMTSSMAGQYLIAPSRRMDIDGKEVDVQGSKAIACGCLGGFGGFLHKEFRIHDYFLGRANCEKFLRDHFTVPVDPNSLESANSLFKEGYSGLADKRQFLSSTDKEAGLQIIPIFSPRSAKMQMPVFSSNTDWPVVPKKHIERFRPMVKKRIQTVLLSLDDFGFRTRMLLWVGAKAILNKKLAELAMDTIMDSLADHRLLK